MTFLPIVDRELRLAARRRGTFWLRVVAALAGFVIGAGFLLISLAARSGLGGLGGTLFGVLTWLSLAAALGAGLFFTADCLSAEKREGTLGFLFLTDLRGYDIVLGKLVATSLQGCFALLAVLPVLAMTMLMGGVTAPQFWKTILALMNALVCSLAAGLLVSALSRDSQKALAATLLLLLALTGGGPIADGVIAAAHGRSFQPILSLASPGYVFVSAGAWGTNPYWAGLLTNLVVAGLLLGLSCLVVPHAWQERSASVGHPRLRRVYTWRFGGARRRERLRGKLIAPNPVLWLACRERWQAVLVWTLTLVAVLGFVVLTSFKTELLIAWAPFGGLLAWVFYLWAASQSCRFFIEARRSGLIELMLSTPLTVSQILEGQWRGLLRLFGLPVLLFLAVQIAATFLSQAVWGGMAGAAAGTVPGVAVKVASMVLSILGNATWLADLVALSWFGMWMGMTSKSAGTATFKTIAVVEILPWFATTFAVGLMVPLLLMPALSRGGTPSPQRLMLFPLISTAVTTVLCLAKDLALSLWARQRFHSAFRQQAALGVAARASRRRDQGLAAGSTAGGMR